MLHLPETAPALIVLSHDNDVWDPSNQKLWGTIRAQEALRRLFGDAIDNPDACWRVYDSVTRQEYPLNHFMDELRAGNWHVGVPYPGVQVLSPMLLREPVSREEARRQALEGKGLHVNLGPQAQGDRKVWLRGVPTRLTRLIMESRPIRRALQYFASDRRPQGASDSRPFVQVPVRFFGGLRPGLLSQLDRLLDALRMPQGSVLHLIGVHPVSRVGEAINNPAFAQETQQGRKEYYRVPIERPGREASGFIVIHERLRGAPGQTASMYSIPDLSGTEAELTPIVEHLHERGMKAIIDATGHLSADSPLVLSQPELFRWDFEWQPLPKEIPAEWEDATVIEKAKHLGYVVYQPDPEGSLFDQFQSYRGLSSGQCTIDGRRYVRYVLRHHEGIGPMTDTVSLNFNNPVTVNWYTERLKRWVTQADMDGFRFDLSDRLTDSFFTTLKATLIEQTGKPLIFVHEDYRSTSRKLNARGMTVERLGARREGVLDVYYNSGFAELFRSEFKWNHFVRHLQETLPTLSQGGFLNHLVTHDEKTPLGKLHGKWQRPAWLALSTLVFTLPGSPSFPWWEAYGWEAGFDDLKREWTYQKFLEVAAAEPKLVDRDF